MAFPEDQLYDDHHRCLSLTPWDLSQHASVPEVCSSRHGTEHFLTYNIINQWNVYFLSLLPAWNFRKGKELSQFARLCLLSSQNRQLINVSEGMQAELWMMSNLLTYIESIILCCCLCMYWWLTSTLRPSCLSFPCLGLQASNIMSVSWFCAG